MQDYRLAIFAFVIITFIVLERIFTRDRLVYSSEQFLKRIFLNFGLLGISQILIILFFRISAVEFGNFLQVKQFGLLNIFKSNIVVHTIATILFMDFIIYWQHRIFHRVNFFWRFHKVHHSDQLLDASSALRFHPFEMIFSMLLKFICIGLIGGNPLGILIFEILLSSLAIFNHSNLQLSNWLNTILEKLIVTPDFHKVHHSKERRLHDSNYGFNLALWDYLFLSYTKSSTHLGDDFEMGIQEVDKSKSVQFLAILKLPFKK